jgi:hypothetical protein
MPQLNLEMRLGDQKISSVPKIEPGDATRTVVWVQLTDSHSPAESLTLHCQAVGARQTEVYLIQQD